MNQINVKEKCWEENAWNKRKRHKLIKKKLTNMKEKILMTLEKRKDIVNTLRGKKKHDTTEEKLYDINKTELPTEEWTEHITVCLEKAYQKHTNTLTEQWDPLKR